MRNDARLLLICIVFIFAICSIYSYYLIEPIEIEKRPVSQENEQSKLFGCNAYVSEGNSTGKEALEELKSRRKEVYQRCEEDAQPLSQPVHSMWLG